MTPTSAIPSGKSVCKYYLQGKCAFGSACPKSHIHLPDAATTSQLSTLSVKNIESSKKEHISAHKEPSESSHNSESGSDESQGNTATEDENDTWISSKTDAGNTSWHWEEPDGEYRDKEEGEEGRSEEGRSEEGRSEEGRSEGGRSEGKGKEEKQEATEKRDPCWFYSLDQCKAGDECPYLHQDPQKAKHVEKSTTNERLFGQNATDRQRRPFVATGRKKSNLAISTIAQSPAPAFVSTERNTMSLVQGKDEYEEERRNQVESWSNWQPQSLSPVSKPPVPRGQPSQTDMYQSPPGLSNNLVDTVYSPPAITVSTGTPVYSISPTPAQPQVPVISAYPQVSEGSFHWSLYADPLANKDIAFCKRHAQGLCMQRELCQFRHSLTVEEYTLLFRDQQPNLCTLSREIGTPLVPSTTITTGPSILHPPYVPQSFFVTPTAVNSSVLASAPAAVPVPVSAAVPVPASTPVPAPAAGVAPHAKVCTFYPVGKCRNGDRCPYQHIGPPPTQAASPELSYSDQGWETTTRSSATKSTMQCRYYVQRGFCRQGNSCQFIHDSSSRETLPDNSNPEEPPPQQEEEEEEEEAKDDALDWTKNSDNDAWGSNNNNEIDTSGWNDPPDTSGWDAPPDLSGWDMPDNNNNASTTKSVKSAGSSSSKARVAKGACRQFAQSGKCSRGRMCIFSHDLEPRKASSSSSSNQKWASRGSSDTTHDPSSTPANVKETKARGKKKVKSRSATPVYLDNNNADKNSSDWVATSVEEPASREEKSGAEPEGMMNESFRKGQEPQVEAPVSPSGSATPPELKEESESSSGSEGTNLEEQSQDLSSRRSDSQKA